ncbi:MAG: hypothetical protein KCHDKBKB_00243 [Elusimicrobia bacterium]|nr:hypothetical protein [Elusimicrobiota bacterium]
MAIQDFYSNFHLIIRWLHVISGIVWIGHLYFFNFVNLQFQTAIDDATKKLVNPPLILRALWWFRWGAMITFISGLILFTLVYMYTPDLGFGVTSLYRDYDGITGRAVWILLGMLFGTIMWFNVWFVIWPTQKGIFGGKFSGDALAAARKKAALFSRINTYLSGPMLFGMLAAPHYSSFSWITFLAFLVIAKLVVVFAYKISPLVGKSV